MTSKQRALTSKPDAGRQIGNEQIAAARHVVIWTLKDRKGRVAAGTDVHRRALVRRASMLEDIGQGGGIVSLLQPDSEAESRRLDKDRNVYRLRRVRQRDGGERAEARDVELIRAFLCKALEIKGWIPAAWKASKFLEWVVGELANKSSPVYKMAAREFPLLVEFDPPRSLRWWQHRWTDLGKMSR